MKKALLLAAIAWAIAAQESYAQFGSGVVFDPTQSAHAVQQIAEANELYTTTVSTTRNVIAAYNLAQHMASLPQSLFHTYTNLGRQQWTILTTPANTYGNSQLWMNSASTGFSATTAIQTASFPRTAQLSGYSLLSSSGQQAISARGATIDLSDAINASNLQTIGTIRANAEQREADIAQLEADSHSTDSSQQTEMAALQRINQALLIELRSQQETNQILQAQALQQLIGQKQQQDNLKALFQVGNNYQQSFNTVTPLQTSSGTQWAFHY